MEVVEDFVPFSLVFDLKIWSFRWESTRDFREIGHKPHPCYVKSWMQPLLHENLQFTLNRAGSCNLLRRFVNKYIAVVAIVFGCMTKHFQRVRWCYIPVIIETAINRLYTKKISEEVAYLSLLPQTYIAEKMQYFCTASATPSRTSGLRPSNSGCFRG